MNKFSSLCIWEDNGYSSIAEISVFAENQNSPSAPYILTWDADFRCQKLPRKLPLPIEKTIMCKKNLKENLGGGFEKEWQVHCSCVSPAAPV